MDRTVPRLMNDNINLYLRTYYSLLRSSREVAVKSLTEVHKRMHSALHVTANTSELDIDAFIYATLRLPDCIDRVNLVIMGQSAHVFAQHGFSDVESWQSVTAPARRRPSFFDGQHTIAVYIASRSDIDDLIPTLTAYQIERQKLYQALNRQDVVQKLNDILVNQDGNPSDQDLEQLSELSKIPLNQWSKIREIWGEKTIRRLLTIVQESNEIAVRLLAGSTIDYGRAIRHWWHSVEEQIPWDRYGERPTYFISSNSHTLANLLSDYALSIEEELLAFLGDNQMSDLLQEYSTVSQDDSVGKENLLYYMLKKYEQAFPEVIEHRITYERQHGIYRVVVEHTFNIEVQIIAIDGLDFQKIDKRLNILGLDDLKNTSSLIINIDYPLGMAASLVLEEIVHNLHEIRGVFSIGKAATLNGGVGDVMIPSVVHDEHSLNTYLFDNCFTADDVVPFLQYGSVMDNQKAITVLGTFLQNEDYMSVFYQEGYTDMEMEGGPYLSCIYEMVRPKRHPQNEIVNLYNIPFLVGFLHYASDTPFSKGTNLGSASLSYHGMDATYAVMIATLRKIFANEMNTISQQVAGWR